MIRGVLVVSLGQLDLHFVSDRTIIIWWLENDAFSVQHWYSLERHRQKISSNELRFSDSEEPKSYQFGLLRKLGGIVCLVLYLSSFSYQFLQMFLWPTVWKDNRYLCPVASPLNSSSISPFNAEITKDSTKVCGAALGLLVTEVVLEGFVFAALFVRSPVNQFPIRTDGLRKSYAVDDTNYHLMTSSSRLNIIKFNNFTLKALLAAFLSRSLSEVLMFTNEIIVETNKDVFWVSLDNKSFWMGIEIVFKFRDGVFHIHSSYFQWLWQPEYFIWCSKTLQNGTSTRLLLTNAKAFIILYLIWRKVSSIFYKWKGLQS